MALGLYSKLPFTSETLINLVDLFTGDGLTETFDLTNLSVNQLGSTIQFNGTQYVMANGGFTENPDGFTLSSAPPLDSQGIAPGQLTLLWDNLFDQPQVGGTPLPQSQAIAAYLADPNEIFNYQYVGFPNTPGIGLTVVNCVSSAAAQTTWVQMACADSNGNALSYGATGAPLYLAPIQAFGTLASSSVPLDTNILCDNAGDFIPGDFILINAGQLTQEIVQITGFTSPNIFTVSALTFLHNLGETIYACGRTVWFKCTVPTNATSGQASNFYNLAMQLQYTRQSRA